MSMVRGLESGQRAALLISECQNNMTNSPHAHQAPAPGQANIGYYANARGIIPKINVLAEGFRAAGLPVIFCNIAAPPNFVGFRVNCALAAMVAKAGVLVTGSWAAKVDDRLVTSETDIINERMHGMAPFTGTELDAILRGLKIDTVVLCGISTNIALAGASIEAVGLGYSVVLVEDCTAGGTPETHQIQVTMNLPLLATISNSESVLRSVSAAGKH